MLKKNCLLLLSFLSVVLLSSCSLFPNNGQEESASHSMLLYTLGNKDSYTLDIDTGEISLVAPGLAGIAWSPSGEKLLFRDVYAEEGEGGLWVSEYDGSNLQQVFSMAEYPKMKIFRALWLTDNIVLLYIYEPFKYNNHFFSLDINTKGLTEITPKASPDFVHPNDDFWIQSHVEEEQRIVEIVSFTGVHDSTTEINYSFYQGKPTAAYSPDGKKFVYIADKSVTDNNGDLWIINVDEKGFSAPRFFAHTGYTTEYNWSPNGKLLGVLKGNAFMLLDGETGSLLKELQVKSRTSRFWWSPDSKSIITNDITDIWKTNVNTGEATSVLNGEKVGSDIPIIVVDWRLVPTR